MQPVFESFRGRFVGKCSPVHFFWGSFDLAVSRFNGARAPERTETDKVMKKIMQEAYSHEVISHGFWPGGGPVPEPVFYAYIAPGAGRIQDRGGSARRGVLQQGHVGVPAAVRSRPRRRGSGSDPARFSRFHLQRRRRSGELGAREARTLGRRAEQRGLMEDGKGKMEKSTVFGTVAASPDTFPSSLFHFPSLYTLARSAPRGPRSGSSADAPPGPGAADARAASS